MAKPLSRELFQQRGFTLIELGVTIAIMVVLTTSVFVARGFYESTKISQTVRQVEGLLSAAYLYSQRYGQSMNYENIDTDELLGLGDNTIALLVTADTAWHDRFEIYPSGPLNDRIRIEIPTPNEEVQKDLENTLAKVGTVLHGDPPKSGVACTFCVIVVASGRQK